MLSIRTQHLEEMQMNVARSVLVASTLFLLALSAESAQALEDPEHCNGDSNHVSHDFDDNTCHRDVNPHYPVTIPDDNGSQACHQRGKTCDGCKTCCHDQKEEAVQCECTSFSGASYNACMKGATAAAGACHNICVGQFADIDGCP